MGRGKLGPEEKPAKQKYDQSLWPTKGMYKECATCERLFDKTGQAITNDTDPRTIVLFATVEEMMAGFRSCKGCRDGARTAS